LVGTWTMLVADAETGGQRARVDLGEPGGLLLHADFDDWRWVGSFASRVVVFDLNEPAPTVVDAGCPAGTVATCVPVGSRMIACTFAEESSCVVRNGVRFDEHLVRNYKCRCDAGPRKRMMGRAHA